MKRITSEANQIFKAAAQLKQKKYRDEQEKYLIEGPNLIREAMQNGGEIELIIVRDDDNAEGLICECFSFAQLDPAWTTVPMAVTMPPGLFRKLSDTETPQGIMAIVKKRICSEEAFFMTVQSAGSGKRTPSNVIVLDRLQDPGNIGTILRTADAAGYLGAMIMKGTADLYSPKIIRAAAGSLFRLPVLSVASPAEAIRLLKKYGKNIICTAPAGDRFYYDVDLESDAAVIIGNEGNGVCEEFLRDSDVLVKIPMEGKIESLNAAVSAGILMYESVRQQHMR